MTALVTINAVIGYGSAQSATGFFNPQDKLQVGSTIVIRSIYGIATVRPHNQTGSNQPPPHWNGSLQSLPTYNASLTIDAQINGDADNGGVQFTVQGGVMVVGGSTIAITAGQGEVNGIDRVTMEGTAVGADGQSLNWRMDGLAALFNGALISELTGNASIILNGTRTNLVVTYIATIS